MIRNKQDLKDYLQRDSTRFGFQYVGGVRNTYSNLLANPASDNRIVWKYIYTLRHCEYYINVPRHNVFQKAAYMVCKLYYLRRLRHLGYITGFQIPPNTCGPGLAIFHYGTIIVGNATLGENCTLFPGVLIGKKRVQEGVQILAIMSIYVQVPKLLVRLLSVITSPLDRIVSSSKIYHQIQL